MLTTTTKLSLVVHTCHPNYTGSKSRMVDQVNPGKNARSYLKNNQSKKAWDVVQASRVPA
jgi:ribosomal protein L31